MSWQYRGREYRRYYAQRLRLIHEIIPFESNEKFKPDKATVKFSFPTVLICCSPRKSKRDGSFEQFKLKSTLERDVVIVKLLLSQH